MIHCFINIKGIVVTTEDVFRAFVFFQYNWKIHSECSFALLEMMMLSVLVCITEKTFWKGKTVICVFGAAVVG